MSCYYSSTHQSPTICTRDRWRVFVWDMSPLIQSLKQNNNHPQSVPKDWKVKWGNLTSHIFSVSPTVLVLTNITHVMHNDIEDSLSHRNFQGQFYPSEKGLFGSSLYTLQRQIQNPQTLTSNPGTSHILITDVKTQNQLKIVISYSAQHKNLAPSDLIGGECNWQRSCVPSIDIFQRGPLYIVAPSGFCQTHNSQEIFTTVSLPGSEHTHTGV